MGKSFAVAIAGLVLGAVLFVCPCGEGAQVDDYIPAEIGSAGASFCFQGTPEEIGRQYGSALKGAICSNVDTYMKTAERNGYAKGVMVEAARLREKAVETFMPSIIIEMKAMAEAAGLDYEDLLCFNLFSDPLPGDDCTSWIAVGNATLDGNSIYHKNRDSSRTAEVVAKIKPENGHSFIAEMTAGQAGIGAGINEAGLAAGNNVGYSLAVNPVGVDNLVLNRKILEECDSVDGAYEMLDNLVKTLGVMGPTMVFLVDHEKGAIVEVLGHTLSSYEESIIVDGVGYRSNHFIVFDEYFFDPQSPPYILTPSPHKIRRYEAARDFLEAKKGNITAYDSNLWSRHHYVDEAGAVSEHDGSICNHATDEGTDASTLMGATFQINKNYPSELSAMWISLGQPCSTIYVPVHLAADRICENYMNGDWWGSTESVRTEKIRPLGKLTSRLLELEEKEFEVSLDVEQEALRFLENGMAENSRTLLTSFDIIEGAWALDEVNSRYSSDSFPAIISVSSVEDSPGGGSLKIKISNLGYGNADGVAVSIISDGIQISSGAISVSGKSMESIKLDFQNAGENFDISISGGGCDATYHFSRMGLSNGTSNFDVPSFDVALAMIAALAAIIFRRKQ